MNNQTKQASNDVNQTMWESWFILSLSTTCAIAFVMCLQESKDVVELPYLLASCVLNLAICVYVGLIKRN